MHFKDVFPLGARGGQDSMYLVSNVVANCQRELVIIRMRLYSIEPDIVFKI